MKLKYGGTQEIWDILIFYGTKGFTRSCFFYFDGDFIGICVQIFKL